MEIGSKLKNARNEKGLTQEQAAEALGVSRQTISNWENNKSYPDIISVIKMSDIYSVSLDHLLKEEKSMNQTYQEFLAESTNTVKAKRRLEKVVLFSTFLFIWAIALVTFVLVNGLMTSVFDVIFRWILLPTLLFVVTVVIAKNDYWGKRNWLCLIPAAISFLTIPYTKFVVTGDTAIYTFCFPNFGYMIVGVVIAALGIGVGTVLNKKKK